MYYISSQHLHFATLHGKDVYVYNIGVVLGPQESVGQKEDIIKGDVKLHLI